MKTFEGSRLELMDDPTRPVWYHVDWDFRSLLGFRIVKQEIHVYQMNVSGKIYQWSTIPPRSRCSCGFMPYSAPILVCDDSEFWEALQEIFERVVKDSPPPPSDSQNA
jgi:hypothetical protein